MLASKHLLRVAWECVHFVDSERANAIKGELKTAAARVFEADASLVETEGSLFLMLANTMEFPDYFGMNWDALDECLRDLSWLPAEAYVLFVRGAERFWKESARMAGSLVESWLFSAEDWAREGKPFHLIFVW